MGLVDERRCFLPIETMLLKKYMHCICKTKSENTCGTIGCTYQKNGMEYFSACTNCRGHHLSIDTNWRMRIMKEPFLIFFSVFVRRKFSVMKCSIRAVSVYEFTLDIA